VVTIIDSRVDEKKVIEERDNELVLDGGFVVPKSKETDAFDAPDMNFLGHSFRDYVNGLIHIFMDINVVLDQN